MTESAPRQPTGKRFEQRATRDGRVLPCDDDREMGHAYHCILIPPTDDANWFAIDSTSDTCTTWARWIDGDHAEGNA